MSRFGIAVAGLAVLLARSPRRHSPRLVAAPERNAETASPFRHDRAGAPSRLHRLFPVEGHAGARLGLNYETQAITTTFYIYNAGIASIPSGATGSAVLTQFQQAIADIEIAPGPAAMNNWSCRKGQATAWSARWSFVASP